MIEFVRLVHKNVKNMFILDVEVFCYLVDEFKHHALDFLGKHELLVNFDCVIFTCRIVLNSAI